MLPKIASGPIAKIKEADTKPSTKFELPFLLNLLFSLLPKNSSLPSIASAEPINARTLLGQRRSLSGSMIGGIAELQQMLTFCGEHNIVCDVEVIKSDYINSAYDRTVASDVKYRFVIDAKTF